MQVGLDEQNQSPGVDEIVTSTFIPPLKERLWHQW
jgi:hypothetical protein